MEESPGQGEHLRLDSQGIWVSESEDAISYPEDGNDVCFSLEEDSFWFRHRNAVIVELLRQFPPPGFFFDIGGGNGYVAAAIEKAGWPTVVVEPGRKGAENARSRGLPRVVCATTQTAGWPAQCMPAVGLFDVLEHIEDDAGFLKSLNRLMQPGGRIYLTVPAYQSLWSAEDTLAGHQRRYTRSTLKDTLQSANFEVEYQSYFFWCLPLPVLLMRTIPTWLGLRRGPSPKTTRSEHASGPGLLSRLLERALRWEQSRLGQGHKMPLGGSCLAVARAPGHPQT